MLFLTKEGLLASHEPFHTLPQRLPRPDVAHASPESVVSTINRNLREALVRTLVAGSLVGSFNPRLQVPLAAAFLNMKEPTPAGDPVDEFLYSGLLHLIEGNQKYQPGERFDVSDRDLIHYTTEHFLFEQMRVEAAGYNRLLRDWVSGKVSVPILYYTGRADHTHPHYFMKFQWQIPLGITWLRPPRRARPGDIFLEFLAQEAKPASLRTRTSVNRLSSLHFQRQADSSSGNAFLANIQSHLEADDHSGGGSKEARVYIWRCKGLKAFTDFYRAKNPSELTSDDHEFLWRQKSDDAWGAYSLTDLDNDQFVKHRRHIFDSMEDVTPFVETTLSDMGDIEMEITSIVYLRSEADMRSTFPYRFFDGYSQEQFQTHLAGGNSDENAVFGRVWNFPLQRRKNPPVIGPADVTPSSPPSVRTPTPASGFPRTPTPTARTTATTIQHTPTTPGKKRRRRK